MPNKNDIGYVYIMRVGALLKVGFSRDNPFNRARTIRHEHRKAVTMALCAARRLPRYREKAIHKDLSRHGFKPVRPEYWNDTQELRAFLNKYHFAPIASFGFGSGCAGDPIGIEPLIAYSLPPWGLQ